MEDLIPHRDIKVIIDPNNEKIIMLISPVQVIETQGRSRFLVRWRLDVVLVMPEYLGLYFTNN